MITLQNISLQRGLKILFDNVSFAIYDKQKIGLVGANGAGKTSLFMLLAQGLQADQGALEIAKGTRIVTVKQEVDDLEASVIDYVMQGNAELHQLKLAMAKALADEAYEEHARLHADFEVLGGYQLESQAAQLLDGLGFEPQQLHAPVKSLSGGWRIRLNLAQALLQQAEILLLDEPTNHLDLDAVMWLERYLQNYQGAVVLISHDRIFLDNVVGRVLYIENKGIDSYTGNYSSFEKQYHEKRLLQQKAHVKQQQKIAHLESFVNRFKAKASKAKQAQSRVKMLEKMQRIEAVHDKQSFSFSFAENVKMPTGSLLTLEDGVLGYGDKVILSGLNTMILPEMRIGLLGKNGAGKSTFVKGLVGDLPLLQGEFKKHPDLKIGYFAQHSLDALDFNASALTHMKRLDAKVTDEQARKFLGRFNFSNEMALSAVGGFSGGEKARLALALIVYQKPNFLLLDEPTNHLDIEVREALAYAMQSFDGALVLISHDRYLLESTVDEYWLVDQGQVSAFDGDLTDYYQYVLEQKKKDKQKVTSEAIDNKASKITDISKAQETPKNKKESRQQRAQLQAKLKPLMDKIKKTEKEMSTLQAQKEAFDIKLQDEAIYQDKTQLNEVLKAHQQTQMELEEKELTWLELNAQLENESSNGDL
ncbi:ABC-F family ATP-binding cassette domain-containing protein [Cysteiniphilum halobium]|uniref:ABC-F family ATP-binding cassette domain-containing protein n=1 Tax=Cysteiniphilum halobium TaxID=2219059 RepID=UPI000E649669|nr:ATP-binding cassette domain-containing protein [Cysteiniphilum halobium]